MPPTRKTKSAKLPTVGAELRESDGQTNGHKKHFDDLSDALAELIRVGQRIRERAPGVLLDELEEILHHVASYICNSPNRVKHKGGRPAKANTRVRRVEFVARLLEELEALGVRYDESTHPQIVAKAKRKTAESIAAEANAVESDEFVDPDDLLHDFNRRARTSKQSLRQALRAIKTDKLP